MSYDTHTQQCDRLRLDSRSILTHLIRVPGTRSIVHLGFLVLSVQARHLISQSARRGKHQTCEGEA